MIMDGSLKFENLNILSHPVDQSLVMITKHKNDDFLYVNELHLMGLANNQKKLIVFSFEYYIF